MISVNSFLSDTLNIVDAVIGNFVNIAYNNFIYANSGLVTLLFTVYIMMLGYRFLKHDHHFNMSQIMRHLIVMLVVYGMVMSWQLYNVFVYNIFTNEPGAISKILVNSTSHSGMNIAQALDEIYKTVIDTTIGFFGQASFSRAGIAFIFYGGLVFFIGTLLCIFALLLFIYAKMMMAVVLALGPIFILFVLWDSTNGMFSAWLRMLITLALIPIVTSAILVLMLSVIKITLPQLDQPIENLQFYGIAPFLGLSLATALLLTQVLRICSALGGGISLSSLSEGVNIAQSSLEKSGVAPTSRKVANWSQKKFTRTINSLFRN